MHILLYRHLVVVFLTIMFFIAFNQNSFSYANKATPITSDTLPSQIQKLFDEHPEIILDVLRNNSEIILEIAQQGSKQRQHRSLLSQWEKELTLPKKVHIEGRPIRGDKNAPITIIAFSDFTCHYCARAASTITKILDSYKGTVKYIFKYLPLQGQTLSYKASLYHAASILQGEEKSWAFYDLLFQNENALLENEEAALKKLAEDAGLNIKQLIADLKNPKTTKMLKEDYDDAAKIDVTGTPYFLIDNLVIKGAAPQETFSEAIHIVLTHKKNHTP